MTTKWYWTWQRASFCNVLCFLGWHRYIVWLHYKEGTSNSQSVELTALAFLS